MAKAKTLKRRKRSSAIKSHSKPKMIMKLKEGTRVRESNPTEEILNEDLISRAIWECFKEGDSEGVIEIFEIYLQAANKTRMAKEASVARSTIYSLKGGNPTVKTLAKLVHACA
jgi:DNA-binding phage protein